MKDGSPTHTPVEELKVIPQKLRKNPVVTYIAENGEAATGILLILSLLLGICLGFLLPTDAALPAPWARISSVIGWSYFGVWTMSWYPQIILNWHHRSTVGLSIDQALYNFFGFACYSVFNCALFFNASVRALYRDKHGGQASGVRSNDVFFSLHANFVCTIVLLQIMFYERGGQRLSASCAASVALATLAALCVFAAAALGLGNLTTLDFLNFLSTLKLATTLIKYIPQIWLNFRRKSTEGWNISNALTDISGGVLSMGQQFLEAWVLHDASIITGDLVKWLLGNVSVVYCLVLAVQHYCIYPARRRIPAPPAGPEVPDVEAPLVADAQAHAELQSPQPVP